MVKLYKKVRGKLHYWETWDTENKSYIVHWGKVGEQGEHEEIALKGKTGFEKAVKKLVSEKIDEGYSSIEEEDHTVLEIVYKIKGMGTKKDQQKLDRLESEMNELLGWTGLGRYDGFSMGSNTMESCSIVVDYEIAVKVITEKLKGTEFENYIRIQKIDTD